MYQPLMSQAIACISQAYACIYYIALPHDITGQCMQLLHGLCCFDFVSDIPLPTAALFAPNSSTTVLVPKMCTNHMSILTKLDFYGTNL
jgi:hypothetical protein